MTTSLNKGQNLDQSNSTSAVAIIKDQLPGTGAVPGIVKDKVQALQRIDKLNNSVGGEGGQLGLAAGIAISVSSNTATARIGNFF